MKNLKVIFVEDSEGDTIVMLRKLETDGYAVTHNRLETMQAFRKAITEQAWDIIIADYRVPAFGASAVLEYLHSNNISIPLIVVSGLVDERAVIETIKSGAYNYVMKNNLERLCVTVERTLREAELFREQKLSKDKIRYLSNITEQITDSVIVTKNKNFEIEYLNVAAEQLFGYSPDEIIGKTPEIFNAELRSNEIQEDIYKTVSS